MAIDHLAHVSRRAQVRQRLGLKWSQNGCSIVVEVLWFSGAFTTVQPSPRVHCRTGNSGVNGRVGGRVTSIAMHLQTSFRGRRKYNHISVIDNRLP